MRTTGAKRVTNKLASRARQRAPIDEHAATELDLYMENTSELYPQKLAILENLKRKIGKGVYDEAKAAKLWMYWVDAGAKRYVKEFGSGSIDTIFNKPTRERVARDMARYYTPDAILRGDY